MSEEYIKKPYTQEEMNQKVEALRNAVTQKVTKWANVIQVSQYFKPEVQRVEGEVWTEDDKLWERKDGMNRSISKLEGARMPWWCGKCSKPMTGRFDRQFWNVHGVCYNCVVDMEGAMIVAGTFEDYKKRKIIANRKAELKDKIQECITFLKEFKPLTIQYYNDVGHVFTAEEYAPLETYRPMLQDIENKVEEMIKELERFENEKM